MTFRTRFAPSPTGPLHLGHAYSALLAYDMAMAAGGDFLLRIEDIDRSRARPEWEEQIYDDLRWLGIWWPDPAMRQSERTAAYQSALDELWQREIVYICTCSRRDIELAASAPQEGVEPTFGPDGLIYPGTCRDKGHGPIDPELERPKDVVLRLDMDRAIQCIAHHHPTNFTEDGTGPDGKHGPIEIRQDTLINSIGDVVLARRDMGTSYHLSVVLDDAAQGITHVVRGQDLFEATKIHVVLQILLGLPTPIYHHHKLIRDENGKRLAKRDDARAIAKFRQDGATPEDIRRMVGL
ncbi:tRNA glutamyl-Q(34) synthetase GluQRS [Aliiroseovarius sp. YM-037]|uniref:tRNA glutamyl-Q(34) synthetase GluQRS n=1 Tax=Aliiroseovarius sp. YM-037 TaxID=3341728 RepID=UPI003A80E97D